MAVRGGAGVGKTYFAASMADAGLGRLCIIDIERKTRLLKGVGSKFDGIEVERSEVRLPGGPIRLVGEHHVKVHLHSDVEVDLTVTVTAEE